MSDGDTMNDEYRPGANWSSKDGKRNVVIVSDDYGWRGPSFTIRNLATGREGRIEISGLIKKFRYAGFDPAFVDMNRLVSGSGGRI